LVFVERVSSFVRTAEDSCSICDASQRLDLLWLPLSPGDTSVLSDVPISIGFHQTQFTFLTAPCLRVPPDDHNTMVAIIAVKLSASMPNVIMVWA